MTKEEILNILEEDVFTVYKEEKEYIDTNNGVLNERYLKNRKKLLLKQAVEYLTDEVVTAKQQYPVNNVSEVDMSIDLVVMKRKDLDYILKYIEEHE
jgi:hypothetical protein